jgi:hypothetical protein
MGNVLSTLSRRIWPLGTCHIRHSSIPGPAYNPIGAQIRFIRRVSPEPSQVQASLATRPPATSNAIPSASTVIIKMPYMENYNLNIQQQLGNHAVFPAWICGSQGHRLWRFFDLSQPSHAQITASDCPNGLDYRNVPGTGLSREATASTRNYEVIPTVRSTSCRRTPPASRITTHCKPASGLPAGTELLRSPTTFGRVFG